MTQHTTESILADMKAAAGLRQTVEEATELDGQSTSLLAEMYAASGARRPADANPTDTTNPTDRTSR